MRSMVVRLLTSLVDLSAAQTRLHRMLLDEQRHANELTVLLSQAVLQNTEVLVMLRDMKDQQHVCDHGTRGWCPSCLRLLLDGGTPQ